MVSDTMSTDFVNYDVRTGGVALNVYIYLLGQI
jgi:hypothetical protein